MSRQSPPFRETLIFWQNLTSRCVLTSDGTKCAVVLFTDDAVVRQCAIEDSETALATATAFRDEHSASHRT